MSFGVLVFWCFGRFAFGTGSSLGEAPKTLKHQNTKTPKHLQLPDLQILKPHQITVIL